MFTPSRPASVVTSASTPGRSGTGTRSSTSSSAAGPDGQVAPGRRARSSTASSASRRRRRRAAPDLSSAPQVVVERGDDRVAVGDADVGPDAGVPGGDAGHVAEAAGREPQQDRVLLAVRRRDVHERRRRELRHVAHHRDERVVVLGRDLDDLGARARRPGRGRSWNASGSVRSVGVSTQVAPANRSTSAPSSPSCSEPAIGCPPTKRGAASGRAASTAADDRRPSPSRRR